MIENNNIYLKDSFTNGYLYKIKDAEGKTRGYLFGTIHELNSEGLRKLNHKIFKFLEKSNNLFIEINYLDPENIIKTNPNLAKLEKGKLLKSIEQIKLEVLNHPESVEDVLRNYAYKTNKEIKSLETIESRLTATNVTQNDRKSFEGKRLEEAACAIRMASNKLNDIANSSNENKDTALNELMDAIERVDFKLVFDNFNQQRFGLVLELNKLIKNYETTFTQLYGEEGKSLMAKVRNFYAASEQFDKGKSPLFGQWRQRIDEAYCKGDSELPNVEPPTKGNLRGIAIHEIDKKMQELDLRELKIRDKTIFKSIQEDLEVEGKGRNFYAVGSLHLLDKNYKNLRVRLEKKGWNIVDAYSK